MFGKWLVFLNHGQPRTNQFVWSMTQSLIKPSKKWKPKLLLSYAQVDQIRRGACKAIFSSLRTKDIPVSIPHIYNMGSVKWTTTPIILQHWLAEPLLEGDGGRCPVVTSRPHAPCFLCEQSLEEPCLHPGHCGSEDEQTIASAQIILMPCFSVLPAHKMPKAGQLMINVRSCFTKKVAHPFMGWSV